MVEETGLQMMKIKLIGGSMSKFVLNLERLKEDTGIYSTIPDTYVIVLDAIPEYLFASGKRSSCSSYLSWAKEFNNHKAASSFKTKNFKNIPYAFVVPTKLFIKSEPLYKIEDKSFNPQRIRTEFSTEINPRYIFIKFQGRQVFYPSEYEAKKALKLILETELLQFNKEVKTINNDVQVILVNLFPNSLEFINEDK